MEPSAGRQPVHGKDRMDGLVRFTIFALLATAFVSNIPALAQGATRVAILLPELFAAAASLFAIGYLIRNKRMVVGFGYIFLGIMFALHLFVSVVSNGVQPGAVVSAIRDYGKYLPLFLLPLVVTFDPVTVRRILLMIAVFALLQTPVALVQRFVLFPDLNTGDVVRGTMASSGLLSIFLISAISVLWSYYLAKRIRLIYFVPAALVLFVPTTINETKGTFLLLPFAFLIPFFISRVSNKGRVAIVLSVMGAVLISSYALVYNYYGEERGRNILDFYASGEFSDYMYSGSSADELNHPRRIDAMVWAYEAISRDPVTMLVGLGAGNVRASFSDVLAGEHTYAWEQYWVNTNTVTSFLWELGVIGLVLLLVFGSLVLRDAWAVRKDDGLMGPLARGWVAVAVIGTVSLVYKDFTASHVHGYLFFLVSGIIVAHRFRTLSMMPSRGRYGLGKLER